MYSQVLLAVAAAGMIHLSCTASDRNDLLERIIGGAEAEPKQFPYQVGFDQFVKYGGWKTNCGGTIISKRIILTAAHCVDNDFTHMKIYFGAVNKSNTAERGQQRLIVDSSHVTPHKEYDPSSLINDIALIRLPADLQFDEYIQPAALPSRNLFYANQAAVVSGWGSIYRNETTGEQTRTNILHQLNVTIMSNEDCKEIIHETRPGKFFSESYICPIANNASPCQGDSGGPLVLKDGLNTLVGITSYSPVGLCKLSAPTVYTRVSSYLDWIEENSKIENL